MMKVQSSRKEKQQKANPKAFVLSAQISNSKPLRIMTWNILAHQFTTHVKRFHRTEGNQGKESPAQTQARYAASTSTILQQEPDVLLLQECGPGFLTPEMELNPRAAALRERYAAYCCFGADGLPPAYRQRAGCAILVRRGAAVSVVDAAFVDGAEKFGGKHYCSIALLLHTEDIGRVWVATLHQCYEAPAHLAPARTSQLKRGILLEAIRQAMIVKDANPTALLGGDFNASSQPQLDTEFMDVVLTEQSSWLARGMARVRVPAIVPPAAPDPPAAASPVCSWRKEGTTGLNPTWSIPVTIDHLYASNNLHTSAVRTGGIPTNPYCVDDFVEAWQGSAVRGSSDHMWVSAEVRRSGDPDRRPAPASPFGAVALLSFGEGSPGGVPWLGATPGAPPPPPIAAPATPSARPPVKAVPERPDHPMKGRRIRMRLARFCMVAGDAAAIVAESKSGSSWELDNGKSVLKSHEGRSWGWADPDPPPPP